MNGDLRVLIADDDSGMRMILRRLIEKADGFTLAGEASDGKQAIELAETLRPDVVFLDVEMPEMTGVECARVIQDMNPAILLIFATAHEGYMGDAFEVYAFDYLVKPFKVERVMQTLERARNLLRSPEKAPEPARPPLSRPRVEGRMMLHHRGGVSFLSFEDIVLIQREERSTVHGRRQPLRHRRFAGRHGGASAPRPVLPLPQELHRQSEQDSGYHSLWPLDLRRPAGRHPAGRAHYPGKIRRAGTDVSAGITNRAA